MIPRAVQLKLDRAEKHMNALDNAIQGFLDHQPYAATRHILNNGTDHVFTWGKFTPIPTDFGLIAGDAIHNLRSSLDHLATALANAGATARGITMTEQEEARIQFPIVLSDDDFMSQIRSNRLKYVDTMAQAFIKARQPYSLMPANPRSSHLFLVGNLDNADKHRQLTVAELAPSVIRDNWPAKWNGIQFNLPQCPCREIGAEIGRFVFPSPESEMNVPVEFRWGFTLWIGYWPFNDIRFILNSYIKTMRGILIEPLSAQFLI